MTKDQFARLQRHRKVKQVLADYAPAVADVPVFAALAAQYQAQLALLDGAARKKPVTSQGATLAKDGAGTALIARLVKVANALYLLYKAARPTPNLEAAAQLHRRPSDYTALPEPELAAVAHDLSQRATANQAALVKDYNLSAADLAALAADAQAFDAQLTAPQLAIDARKIQGATAKATLSALNDFLRDDLRAGMELLKDTHRDAYDALREASQVDDAAYRKRKEKRAKGVAKRTMKTMGLTVQSNGGLVWLNSTDTVWLELTVNTVCEWDFTLPPSIHESQPPLLSNVRVKKYADPGQLIGQSFTWQLVITVIDNKAHDYSGQVRLLQGASASAGTEVYAYAFGPETIDPASGVLSAMLTDTLTFASI